MKRELRVVGGAAAAPALAAATALDTLEAVLAWAREQQPPYPLVDVVVQDELTHDVIVAGGPAYLVFDST